MLVNAGLGVLIMRHRVQAQARRRPRPVTRPSRLLLCRFFILCHMLPVRQLPHYTFDSL